MNTAVCTGLAHVGIKTYDLEKAINFYTDILGFNLVNRIKPGDVELVFLQLADLVIELVEAKDGVTYPDGVVNHLALQVKDIFAAAAELTALGVELLTPEPQPLGGGRYNFFFRGPSGEKLELLQG